MSPNRSARRTPEPLFGPRARRALPSRVLVLFAMFVALFTATTARAQCSGPDACCITDPAKVTIPLPERVRLGVRVVQLNAVNERDGTYSLDVQLLTRWPAGGLRPDPQARNAGESTNVVSDEVTVFEGSCYRALRIHDTLETWFQLERFPFDRQNLRLILEDTTATPEHLVYEDKLWPLSIDASAYYELTSWRFEGYPVLKQTQSQYAALPGVAHARKLTISVPVSRLWQFYAFRYFLPLMLIVAIAFSIFWIRPEDLGSAAAIGVTCLLAIIAFQITQADSLPRVAYLTLADRIYAICYIATACTMVTAVHEAYLAHGGQAARAIALDKKYRTLFPLGFAVAIAVTIAVGWGAQHDATLEHPGTLDATVAPANEKAW